MLGGLVFVQESLKVKQTKKETKLPSISIYVSHVQERMALQSCSSGASPTQAEVAREIALSRKQALELKQELNKSDC
jgi:hypothetical protein